MTMQDRNRAELRQDIATRIDPVQYFSGSTTSAGGNSTSVIDTKLFGGTNEYEGWWVYATSTNNAGEARRASGYVAACTDITVTAFSNTVACGMAYQLFPPNLPPDMIDRVINQSIIEATGKAYDYEESQALYLQFDKLRYDIPAEFSIIYGLEQRMSVDGLTIEQADTTWTTVATNITQAVDTQIKRAGGASLRVTPADGFGTGTVVTQCLTSALDISSYDAIELWYRGVATTAACEVSLILLECCTTRETLVLDAISTADRWQYMQLNLATPEVDCSINKIRIVYSCDPVLEVRWIDEIMAVRKDTAQWLPISNTWWNIDQSARDIVFKGRVSCGRLKIRGGDEPALLSDCTANVEVCPEYIVAWSTNMIRSQRASSAGEREFFFIQAEQAKGSLAPIFNGRKVNG